MRRGQPLLLRLPAKTSVQAPLGLEPRHAPGSSFWFTCFAEAQLVLRPLPRVAATCTRARQAGRSGSGPLCPASASDEHHGRDGRHGTCGDEGSPDVSASCILELPGNQQANAERERGTRGDDEPEPWRTQDDFSHGNLRPLGCRAIAMRRALMDPWFPAVADSRACRDEGLIVRTPLPRQR